MVISNKVEESKMRLKKSRVAIEEKERSIRNPATNATVVDIRNVQTYIHNIMPNRLTIIPIRTKEIKSSQ